MDIFEQLASPFPPDRVSWRPGSMTKDKSKAQALAYIDARDVMQRLDRVVTPAGWQCRYVQMQGTAICCEIAIKHDGEWIWKANGAGHTDIEAEKGAFSDAFKRAAVLWGVGQYLYDLDSPWVELDEYKRIAKSQQPKLLAVLNGVKSKSSSQAKKDGDWKILGDMVRACESEQELNELLVRQVNLIGAIPAEWLSRFDDVVEGCRAALGKRNAA